jgi:hypothetical protein
MPIKMNHTEWKQLKLKWDIIINEITACCEKYKNNNDVNIGVIEFTDYKILSKSNGDPFGKVYEKNQYIYRAIRKEKATEFIELWRSGLLQGLMEYKLIPNVTISKYKMCEYPIVLEVEKMDVSPANLWTFSMVKDAALCTSLIKTVSNNMGYFLVDGHTNNITFHDGRAVLIDIGSIQKRDGRDINCGKEVVMTMGFRMVFDIIGNSIMTRKLIYDDMDNGMRISPYVKEDSKRECVNALKVLKKYHIRSGLRTQWIIHKVFDELDIKPCYIDYLFQMKINKEFKNARYEIMDYSIWIDMLLRNGVQVGTVAELGEMGGALCKNILQHGIAKKARILEYDERYGECTYWKMKEAESNINVYLFNYIYKAEERSISAVKSDLLCISDIWNNMYVSSYWGIEDIFNALYILTNQYVIYSYNTDQVIKSKLFLPKEFREKELKDNYIRCICEKWFDIVDMQETTEGKENYGICLLKKK